MESNNHNCSPPSADSDSDLEELITLLLGVEELVIVTEGVELVI